MAACTPNFTPGTSGCIMPTYDENRARLKIGGTLFRSIDTGSNVNDITVECIWFVCIDDTVTCSTIGGNIRQYDSNIDTFCDTVAFEIIIYSSNVEVERYRVDQSVDCGSPITWTTGINSLRTTLSTNSAYVILPTQDVQTLADDPNDPNRTWDTTQGDDADHLSEFPKTNLSVGSGINNNPSQSTLDAIRTGPGFTLINIGNSEIQNADGVVSNLNQPKYWNGIIWAVYDSINPPSGCDS